MDTRPHAGPLLARFEPPFDQSHRERHVDTMLCCIKNERLNVHYVAEYSAISCKFSTWRLTNQAFHKMHVAHCTVGLVEPRGNTMPQGSWRYKTTADSPALCPGFVLAV